MVDVRIVGGGFGVVFEGCEIGVVFDVDVWWWKVGGNELLVVVVVEND